MENLFNTPHEALELNMKAGVNKARMPILKMILLGVMAGAFIALGGATSSTAAHNISNVGLARLVAGCIFPIGLMIIVFVGGELFTGNCLLIMGVIDKRIKAIECIKNLVIVWLSNLVGALIIDVLIYFSGNLNYSSGLNGAYAIKVALSKATISPVSAITSGILCNILVCIAILVALAAKDLGGKIWGIFFPIMAFVVGGFEHVVANMFYIPMGMMAAMNPTFVAKASEAYGITSADLQSLNMGGLINNFIFVTIGNILGGMLFVGVPCYLASKRKA